MSSVKNIEIKNIDCESSGKFYIWYITSSFGATNARWETQKTAVVASSFEDAINKFLAISKHNAIWSVNIDRIVNQKLINLGCEKFTLTACDKCNGKKYYIDEDLKKDVRTCDKCDGKGYGYYEIVAKGVIHNVGPKISQIDIDKLKEITECPSHKNAYPKIWKIRYYDPISKKNGDEVAIAYMFPFALEAFRGQYPDARILNFNVDYACGIHLDSQNVEQIIH